LLVQSGTPGRVYRAWSEGAYTLLTCQQQLYELREVLSRPAILERIRPHRAGRLVNELKNLAVMMTRCLRWNALPIRKTISCPAAAEAGKADFLVTGDKSGLLSLTKHGRARIVTAAVFAAQFV
jgi:predicted nucleic acid-binding protein